MDATLPFPISMETDHMVLPILLCSRVWNIQYTVPQPSHRPVFAVSPVPKPVPTDLLSGGDGHLFCSLVHCHTSAGLRATAVLAGKHRPIDAVR